MLAHQLTQLVDDRVQLKGNGLDFQASGLDTRQVQNVLQQSQQRMRRHFYLTQLPHLLRGEGGGAQQVRHADNGIHRRADLVAHIGQKLALGGVGALGFLAGVMQAFFHPLFGVHVGGDAINDTLAVGVDITPRGNLDPALLARVVRGPELELSGQCIRVIGHLQGRKMRIEPRPVIGVDAVTNGQDIGIVFLFA